MYRSSAAATSQMAFHEALTTRCMLEQTKGAGSRKQRSPVHLTGFKNKAVLWTVCFGLVVLKLDTKQSFINLRL